MYNESRTSDDRDYNDFGGQRRQGRASTWGSGGENDRRASSGYGDGYAAGGSAAAARGFGRSTYSDNPDAGLERRGTVGSGYGAAVEKKGPPPGRPTAPKPVFRSQRSNTLGEDQVVALYTFNATQDGDLGEFCNQPEMDVKL